MDDPVRFGIEVDRVGRIEDLWELMVGFARAHGVARVGYHHLPPPGAADAGQQRILNSGFPQPLLARYIEARLTGVALLAQTLQAGARPVYLEDLDQMAPEGTRERAHLDAYRAAGVVNGLGLQAFGPQGRNAIFAIDLAAAGQRLTAGEMVALRWGCQSMHLRYCELVVRELGDAPALSGREIEVLTWVAHGKTNAAVGEILGISAHTVDAHLRRVYLKLGVADRISAALRALSYGLITVDPSAAALRKPHDG